METETQIVGQAVPRLDALDKVQGKAEYTVDLALPRMLYGSFLCSPLARAKILNIDASKARRVPGVRVVVTGKDFPYTYGSTIKDRPFLAQGQVRYVGEPVAAAAATSQEMAEELGVKIEKVHISSPDTDYTPFDTSSTSSRSTYHMGNAIRLACADAKRQMLQAGSELLRARIEDVELAEGVIRVKDQPEKLIALKDVVPKYFGYRGGTIVGRGIYRPTAISPDKETGQTAKITPFWMYGTQAAEVEVDPQTGKVEVLRLVAYHDVGHAINPTNCMQQIEGAVLMGVSGALLEEVVLNERGATVNPNLHDYKVYTAVDVPGLEVGLIETEQSEGPFGAKGVGEPALAATAPAIGNAIFAACGVRIRELPITPEKMLFALKAAQVLQPDKRGVKYA